MPIRSRLRAGREVNYYPTAVEVTAQGAGPWPGTITKVNTDGTADLVVDPPAASSVGAALTDPLIAAAALAAFTDPPSAAEMALTRTLANELRTDVNTMVTRVNQVVVAAGRKASVRLGGAAGQFAYA